MEDVSLAEVKSLIVPQPKPLVPNFPRARALVGRRVRKQFDAGWVEGVINGWTEHGWLRIKYEVGFCSGPIMLVCSPVYAHRWLPLSPPYIIIPVRMFQHA
jgi:hypothetical protein